ncbi:MAG TPA: MFS transporter [Gammaproteobacteria bacterium]|nr:MFS transporter [Gammaproteobacteria bacterium]
MNDSDSRASHTSVYAVRHYALCILVVVYTFNFIDRQILSILMESIKLELGLSDQALGFLVGFAFAAFYAVLGIPIALWADRGNRRNIISLALALWSVMTALSGLAQNFTHLALARIGVGVGEAGCSPPAHSLISDYYPPEQRATALGIYSIGIPLGVMFGLFVGGWVNEAYGWRYAFFVVGIPGLLLAALVRFTLHEPLRGLSENRSVENTAPSFAETIKFLLRRRAFLHIALGGALAAFVGYGVVSWFPTFLIRSHAMKTTEIGLWFGLIMGIPGGAGIFLGGYLADKFGAVDPRWYLWTAAAASILALPFGFITYILSNPYWALAVFSIPILLSNFWQATVFAQTQSLVRLRMRGVASAILLFIINIIGLGAGPWAIGILSDLLRPHYGPDSLRWSLMIFGSLGLWVAYHFFAGGKYLAADLARVENSS